MKTYLFFIALLLSCSDIYSQGFPWGVGLGDSWADQGKSINVDSKGNIVVTGLFKNQIDLSVFGSNDILGGQGYADIFILKLTPEGELIWAKSIGGEGWDIGFSIITDTDDNIILAGVFESEVDFDPGPSEHHLRSNGKRDAFILKMDPDGNFLWASSFGGPENDGNGSVIMDKFSNIYTTGVFEGEVDFDPDSSSTILSSFHRDIFIQKFDQHGDFLWAKNMGGDGTGSGNAVHIGPFGNIFLSGHFNNTFNFNPGGTPVYRTSEGKSDSYVLKLDPTGDFQWVNTFGGTKYDFGEAVTTDMQGNVFVIGDLDNAVDIYNADSLVVGSIGGTDCFVQKLDNDGNLLWERLVEGRTSTNGNMLQADTEGNVYVLGSFSSLVDFDPGIDSVSLLSKGPRDIFFLKYDPDGNLLFAIPLGGNEKEEGLDFVLAEDDRAYFTGHFESNFTVGEHHAALQAEGGEDIFILKLDSFQTLVSPKDPPHESIPILRDEFLVYPNPTNGLLTIRLPSNTVGEMIFIFDSLGRLVHQAMISERINLIDISFLSPGIYYLNIEAEIGNKAYQKIIISE